MSVLTRPLARLQVSLAGFNSVIAVAQEIIDELLTTNKHEITVLSRSVGLPKPLDLSRPSANVPKGGSQALTTPGTRTHLVDYTDKNGLVDVLSGVHTLLSFVQPLADADGQAQRNLIDAAILAGVKRFAPSEYGR